MCPALFTLAAPTSNSEISGPPGGLQRLWQHPHVENPVPAASSVSWAFLDVRPWAWTGVTGGWACLPTQMPMRTSAGRNVISHSQGLGSFSHRSGLASRGGCLLSVRVLLDNATQASSMLLVEQLFLTQSPPAPPSHGVRMAPAVQTEVGGPGGPVSSPQSALLHVRWTITNLSHTLLHQASCQDIHGVGKSPASQQPSPERPKT